MGNLAPTLSEAAGAYENQEEPKWPIQNTKERMNHLGEKVNPAERRIATPDFSFAPDVDR
jgi:hypothetical protein